VPLGLGKDSGMPVSAQLQGPAFSDRKLLQFARALERAFDAKGTVAPAFVGKGGELA
jgi:aspartyl-tRNA(Asn)/glutamyl-tRNA(Gln) amidotransferase subunit A